MTQTSHTQVAIIGAGPAGLLLSHLLDLCGISSVVLESRSRESVENTVRAGVLEQNTVDLLDACGLGERMHREGAVHHGIKIRFNRQTHRIDMHRLTGGRAITIYAQHEVLRDLIAAGLAANRKILFEVQDVKLHDIESPRPSVTYRHAGSEFKLTCDFIAGCDGFHGISRPMIPRTILKGFDRVYHMGWLGILINAPPSTDELIYARHERGFALVSTRSPTVQRLYIQCDPSDDMSLWPDSRIWSELEARLEADSHWQLLRGDIFQKNIVSMRSFVAEPMQFGRLFLAGDAAHIVPPTGAKGLNLAVSDVAVLASGLVEYFNSSQTKLLDNYTAICLPRIWRAQRFSAWMTNTLHRLGDGDPFQEKLQITELEYLTNSPAAATSLAENYVGVPLPSEALRIPWSRLTQDRASKSGKVAP